MTWRWNTRLLDAVLAHFRLKKSLVRPQLPGRTLQIFFPDGLLCAWQRGDAPGG
jgi:hypothetical protein